MTVALTIDGRPVEVAPGQTVLDAARKLGIDIPTLCYLERCGPLTSCLVCLVKITTNGQSRLAPSCGLVAQPGMAIESESPEVHTARRTALELLFSDHVGDCLAPCHRICPLGLNIPTMLRHVEAQRFDAAIATVRQALPLPAILGRLCHHPCENGCRRGTHDQPTAIRDVERFVADRDLASNAPCLPPRKPPSGKIVAIVGAGPAGLAAAHFLLLEGHQVAVFDRHPAPGGSLRREIELEHIEAPVLEAELERLETLGAVFQPEQELGRGLSLEDLTARFDAVLLALGESGKGQAQALGLAVGPTGIQTDPRSARTSLPKVHAAGAAARPSRQLVRVMADGRTAARALGRVLLGLPLPGADRPFSNVMGRLEPIELQKFLIGPSLAPRQTPSMGLPKGFSIGEARSESCRCLHCDCRAEGNCTLQHYAELYGVEAGRFRSRRRLFEQHVDRGEIVFEPGKCILCGICVRIAEQAQEPLGLTFIGRGFEVRIAAPFNRTIAEGLQKVARDCVDACPTGALAFQEDTRPAAKG